MCPQTVSETTAFALYPSRWLMQLAKNMTQDNNLANGAYVMYSYASSFTILSRSHLVISHGFQVTLPGVVAIAS